MAYKIANSTLQASTIDILNVIRANANYEYQQMIPEITQESQIVGVGETLKGYPALANTFINALMNRIALVRIRSALFYNPYEYLKKGYLEYGETIEEVFVDICKVLEFSAEKAEEREFKRYLPDVQAAFHVINWKVLYPMTIQQQDLERAFTSLNGVTDMISRLIDSIYTAASYDEYLLFKYMMIKGITGGKVAPKSVNVATSTDNAAIAFRANSNDLTFLSTKYNASGVHTVTPREDQVIFMSSQFNAQFDVEVLAGAFNMDKADFIGRLYLIDEWASFDNDRWEVIRAASTGVEEVTAAELAIMENVVAFVCDREWFQVYDNLNTMKEKEVASGLYWNYFYHVWKTVSSSPFSNAVVFVTDAATTTLPSTITVEVTDKSTAENATVISYTPQFDDPTLVGSPYQFIQTQDCVEAGIAVHKYGAYMYPANAPSHTISMKLGDATYTASVQSSTDARVGDTVTLSNTANPAVVQAKAKSAAKE